MARAAELDLFQGSIFEMHLDRLIAGHGFKARDSINESPVPYFRPEPNWTIC